MKVTPKAYAAILADMTAVFDQLSVESQTCFMLAPDRRAAWQLWHKVVDDRRHDDNHPRFRDITFEDGTKRPADVRRLPHVGFDFELYPCDTNDETLATALVKAWKAIKGPAMAKISSAAASAEM